jgi:hypothetical protein
LRLVRYGIRYVIYFGAGKTFENMKNWFEKTGCAMLSAMILALSFGLTACKSEDGISDGEQTEATVQRCMRNEHLVALAVCRVYDGKGISVKSSGGNPEETSLSPVIRLKTDMVYPHIKYEFDYVKIGDAVH